jgi:transcriptional regulator with XRE-family HTH domain
MEIGERFGRNLRRERVRAELTQEEVADLAGMHRTEVSLLETGGRIPRLKTLLKLVGAIGTSTDLLLEGIDWVPAVTGTGGFEVSAPRD